jgi:metallo-beta-lactamase class B
MRTFLWLMPLFLLSACVFLKKNTQRLDTETLKIQPLTEGVFVHISYFNSEQFGYVPCNGMVYVRGGEAIVFDTPTDDAVSEILIHWIEKRLKKRIKAVVINHFHEDCLGGLGAFHAHAIPSFANRLTIELAQSNAVKTLPQHAFDESLSLTCGDRPIENRFFGEGHTRDNIVSYLPVEKTLFGGCLIKTMNAGKGNLADANTASWSATVEQVKRAYPDVRFVIPGHGATGSVELLDFTARLFQEGR